MNESTKLALDALEEGRPNDAIVILEPMVDDALDDEADILVYLGIAYVQTEQPRKAVEVLERAEDLVEEHCVLSMFLGRAYRALARFDDAEDELSRSISLDPDTPEPYADLGWVLFKKGEYAKTVKTLASACEAFPEEPDIRAIYALSLYRLGDFTAAAVQWGLMHRQEPEFMSAVSNYAFLMLTLRRSYEAVPFVGRANTLAPEDYRSLILLGELRFQSGEHEGARECFLKVLDQDKDNVEALSRLAVLYHHLLDKKASDEYLQRAESLVGQAPENWRGLCYALSAMGRDEDFVNCLIEWTRVDPTSAAPWVALAKHYDRTGKLEYSRNAWRVSFELRDYVKILCDACGSEFRLPYDGTVGFDIYSKRICHRCGKTISMPAGLAEY
ncbi:MAG: tetratricopeptide repeat protein [Candidatus Thorarchaeota archaeon]|jgi:tetratricopeptide (TPR) repeat protein